MLPDNELSFSGNFLNMLFKMTEPRYKPHPVLERALDVLFILHADHEQNCSTHAMRGIGSSHADPYSSLAGAAAALYGPLHGGANEAVLKMLTEIGSIENVPAFIKRVKAGEGRLMGFGHRVYKSYDPRATIIKRIADLVFEVTGETRCSISRSSSSASRCPTSTSSRGKLYPNVDFYSGLIYQAMGFPGLDVPGPVRHPAHRRLDRAVGGDAYRPRTEDRPAAPDLHRAGQARLCEPGEADGELAHAIMSACALVSRRAAAARVMAACLGAAQPAPPKFDGAARVRRHPAAGRDRPARRRHPAAPRPRATTSSKQLQAAGVTVEEQPFEATTPLGRVKMVNLRATLPAHGRRRNRRGGWSSAATTTRSCSRTSRSSARTTADRAPRFYRAGARAEVTRQPAARSSCSSSTARKRSSTGRAPITPTAAATTSMRRGRPARSRTSGRSSWST